MTKNDNNKDNKDSILAGVLHFNMNLRKNEGLLTSIPYRPYS